MKTFLFSIAMIIMYIIFITYQVDNNTYIRQLDELKVLVDECAATASLYYDEEAFSKGNIIYNQKEGIKAIEYLIKYCLKLDNNFVPNDHSYWQDTIKYDVFFMDDSNTSFPYLFQDSYRGYTKLITNPTVVVVIDAGRARFRLEFLESKNAIRVSSYEYLERFIR